MKEKRIREITRELKLAESLLKYVKINTDTGTVVWRKSPSNRVKVGDKLGSLSKGYLVSYHRIPGSDVKGRISVHRLIFYYVNGYLPALVDHEDRVKVNNWISNLREATKQENNRNSSIRSDNTSGANGVYWSKKLNKWYSQITIAGKTKTLGFFKSKKEAISCREVAELKYFGEFAP